MGRLYSSKIHNNTNTMVSVSAIYQDDNNQTTEEVSQVLEPFKSHTFGPKTSGSRLRISRIEVSDNNKRTKQFVEPFVTQDKEKVDFNVAVPFEDIELHRAESGGRSHEHSHHEHYSKGGFASHQ